MVSPNSLLVNVVAVVAVEGVEEVEEVVGVVVEREASTSINTTTFSFEEEETVNVCVVVHISGVNVRTAGSTMAIPSRLAAVAAAVAIVVVSMETRTAEVGFDPNRTLKIVRLLLFAVSSPCVCDKTEALTSATSSS
jgi:hypothetical protein